MGNSLLAKFLKLRGKTSIVEFNFIKVVGQKSDAVTNMERFLKVFWNYWNGWRHEVKGNSKIKLYSLCLWDCDLSFPRNLGEKSNIKYLTGENFVGEKWHMFLEISSLFSVKNFPLPKLSPIKIFPNEKLYLPNTFSKWKLKLRRRQAFRNYNSVVNMVKD